MTCMSEMLDVFDVYKYMNKENIIFAYTGTFEHFVTTTLLKSIKRELKRSIGANGLDKRVYNVVVESIENLSKYSPVENNVQSSGIILLCKRNGKYVVITGNYILNQDIPKLKEKLENVLSLSPEELKNVYREQIISKRIHENKAGLGIIDIAIKSGNKIMYNFKQNSDNTSFYIFQTEINAYH